MDAPITEALNKQTFMFVWDINLKTTNKVDRIDILTPRFTLVPNKNEKTNWIRLKKYYDKIEIKSNFSDIKELKAYMIDTTTCTLLEVSKDFTKFAWNKHQWSEKMRFVFELEMQCDAPAVPPTIWKHCITETKPAINTNEILLHLDDRTSNHTVVNSSGNACEVNWYIKTSVDGCRLAIKPETPSENWNLLTVMLIKQENNSLERHHFHYIGEKVGIHLDGLCPIIITEIHELKTSLENISDIEMAAIKSVIKPNLHPSPSKMLIEASAITSEKELNPTADEQELKYRLRLSSNLKEFYDASIFCDISIHVHDHQIRAHKLALFTGSIIWRDFFKENEKLDAIHIADFDYETIKDLIEYLYTGKVKETTDQLLIAADKYGVADLKQLCEKTLIETIGVKNVVKLLILADRYKASALLDKVVDFIVENCKAVSELEEAKGMFMMYPELGFKLFARLSNNFFLLSHEV